MENVEILGTPVPDVVGEAGTVAQWEISDAFDGATLAGKTSLNAADIPDGIFADSKITAIQR